MPSDPKKNKPSGRKTSAAKAKRKPSDEEDIIDAEILDDGDEAASASKPRQEEHGEARGFFETLSDGLKSAGETATRYTRMGVARAELEKLRFDLKGAHAKLGETVVHCWDDAPSLGLTAKDPAIAEAFKRVKEMRLKIREKEAQIAGLKRDA